MNEPRCECHECTQARYKSSFQGQFDTAMGMGQQQKEAPKLVSVYYVRGLDGSFTVAQPQPIGD